VAPLGRSLPGVVALLASLLAGACADETGDDPIVVVLPGDGHVTFDRIEATLQKHLRAVVGRAIPVRRMKASTSFAELCDHGETSGAAVVIAVGLRARKGGESGPKAGTVNAEDGFELRTDDVGDWDNAAGSKGATILRVSSGQAIVAGEELRRIPTVIGAYEVLRRFGVRFFHPEEPFVPDLSAHHDKLRGLARRPTAVAPGDDADRAHYIPDFHTRGFSFHGSHPLEHLESFSDSEHPIDEALHVNEWILANRGNQFRGAGRGVVTGERRDKRVKELGAIINELGYARGAGITLHNEQQGANAAIDPGKPTPVKEQIENYVASRVHTAGVFKTFGIHFGPTEFTVTPDKETVDWINWAGGKAMAIDPDIVVMINDHTSGSQATEHFDDLGCPAGTNSTGTVDYYDLAFHSDPRFGVKVHTVMFHPLEGPAHVYNQKTFAHKLCLMKQASAAGRPLSWFPEGSWWLSFDNPIPVYLPLYIWTRGRDIELVRPLLTTRGAGTLFAHRMFNSGHEWGYWQQDYAVGMWHWNADVTMAQFLDELFDPLCELPRASCSAKTVAGEVLTEVMAHQKAVFLDHVDHRGLPGGLYAYFAGEDPADEIAAVTGFEFRPVRVSFRKVAAYKDKDREAIKSKDIEPLAEADAFYAARVKKLSELDVPARGKAWLAETIDGLEINMLRARQTVQLYRAALAHGAGDEDAAAKLLADAAKTLAAAEVVIRRREKAYRYPAEQTHGGGITKETAKPNGTTYPWRVHTKTHLLTYWKNRHQQVTDLLAGKSAADAERLRITPSIAKPGTPVKIAWPALAGLTADVDMGDANTIDATVTAHDYGAGNGVWKVSGKMTTEGREIGVSGAICRTPLVVTSEAKKFKLIEPDNAIAAGVLSTLFPSFRWAVVPGKALVFGPDPDGDGEVAFDDLVAAPLADPASADIVTKPVDFTMPVPDPATGDTAVLLGLSAVVVSGPVKAGVPTALRLKGQMSVTDLVKALIDLAGFDEKGALKTLSGVLGFDPAKPPKTVPFVGDVAIAGGAG